MAEKLVESGFFDRIALARIGDERALSEEKLGELFERFPGCAFVRYDNVEDAFYALLQEKEPEGRVYVTGSLYLVGEIKELLNNDKFRRRIEEISAQP